MLKVVQEAESSNENTAGSSLLDEIVRDGARQMLAVALRAEVAAYVEAFAAATEGFDRSLGFPALEDVDAAGVELIGSDGRCVQTAPSLREWEPAGHFGVAELLDDASAAHAGYVHAEH